MAFSEDLSPYFADWGVTGTLSAGSVTGIFDRDTLQALAGEITATGPVFLVKSADVTTNSIASGASITVGGTAYRVKDLQPNGTGLTLLILEVA